MTAVFKMRTSSKPRHQHIAVMDDESSQYGTRLCDSARGKWISSDPTIAVCQPCVQRLIAVAEDMHRRLGTITATIAEPGPAPDLYGSK